ncbi:MAG: M81 family metallopeptidase [Proteobacteria bacterium]|nr:M81 family metallopeptidase [Pseudomonadota bacterium]
MNSPRVALMGMILESNRYSKPASRADFESLTWMGGNALMAEARGDAPSLAQEFAAFVRAMDATGPWTPVPVLLAASHPHGPVEEVVFEEYAEALADTTEAARSGTMGGSGRRHHRHLCHLAPRLAEGGRLAPLPGRGRLYPRGDLAFPLFHRTDPGPDQADPCAP